MSPQLQPLQPLRQKGEGCALLFLRIKASALARNSDAIVRLQILYMGARFHGPRATETKGELLPFILQHGASCGLGPSSTWSMVTLAGSSPDGYCRSASRRLIVSLFLDLQADVIGLSLVPSVGWTDIRALVRAPMARSWFALYTSWIAYKKP